MCQLHALDQDANRQAARVTVQDYGGHEATRVHPTLPMSA